MSYLNSVMVNNMPDDHASGLTSVDNALRLLQLVQQRRVLRVAEAATELGVARSTAHRLLNALRHRGFVEQDRPNSVYRPGWSLRELGLAAVAQFDIRQIARPVMDELRDTTQETVSLMVLEGRSVRFVECVESPRSVRVGTRTGLVLPAHCTAGGKAILAALPDIELGRRYPDRELESRTAASINDWDLLGDELAGIRRLGYAINIGESETGISAVGVALLDPIGAPLGSLNVAVPGTRMATVADGEAVAPVLLQAQRAIGDLIRRSL